MERPGMQEWNNGTMYKMTAKSEEGEDVQQDPQKDCRAGNREENSSEFNWIKGNYWIT
jgi:hypothetical protein